MDNETITAVKDIITDIAEEHGITLDEVIVFGSRVREDYRERSDIDILIVSSSFEDVPANQRSRPFYLEWAYGELPTPELICLTPAEFRDQKDRDPHIVNTATEEGVSIA